jgi:protein involved in polysaccharide export with SLBB domain
MNRIAFLGLLFASALAFWQATPTVPSKGNEKVPDGVVLIGWVRTPQVIRHSAELTVRSAIAAAGGTSDFSDWIYVIRNGVVKIKTSGRRMEKDPREDIVLLPWDIVCAGSIPVR